MASWAETQSGSLVPNPVNIRSEASAGVENP